MIKNDIDIWSVASVPVNQINSPFSGDNTYSTLFLTPAFDVYLEAHLYHTFINSYIDDAEIKHLFKRPLFALIKYKERTLDVKEVNAYLKSKPSYVYSYLAGTYKDCYLRVYVFECPSAFKNDYDRFIKGEYSKFSYEYKDKFNKTTTSPSGIPIESPLYGVVNKTGFLKRKMEKIMDEKLSPSQEYFGIPIPEFEVFRYVKPKQDDNK